MPKKQSNARNQRRAYELYLKKNAPEQYKIWKSTVIERGAKTHEQNTEEVRKSEEAYFEGMQAKIIQSMKDEGKSNEEIDEYINDWVKTLKVWGSNERPMRRREIIREKQSTND